MMAGDWDAYPPTRKPLRGCTCLASYDGAKCEVCEDREAEAERKAEEGDDD